MEISAEKSHCPYTSTLCIKSGVGHHPPGAGACPMQVTTLSFFRFKGLLGRIWAFLYMQFGKRPLRSLPGIGFHKLMGTGSGEGFDPSPNFSVYAILATWPSLEDAQRQVEQSEIYSLYRRRSIESWTIYLTATRARGSWDKVSPFEPSETGLSQASNGEWIGVLTRASIRLRSLFSFWRTVPPISQVTAGRPGLHFKLGMGEQPVVQLMTFSLWKEVSRIKEFAYQAGPHREAMKLARSHEWFREELFARFKVLGSTGSWNGRDPLKSSPSADKDNLEDRGEHHPLEPAAFARPEAG